MILYPMQERGFTHEVQKPIESLAEQQKAAARIDFYLGMQHYLKHVAKEHVSNHVDLNKKQKRNMRKNTVNALLDLYLIKENQLPEEPFRESWGEKAHTFENLLSPHIPVLESLEKRYSGKADEYDAAKRARVAIQATSRLKGLSEEQRERLLNYAGYSAKQQLEITKKLTKSLKASLALGGFSYASIIAGTALEKASPLVHLGSMSNTGTLLTVLFSYVANYGATYLNARTNHKLLEDKNVQNSPNFFVTSLYLLAKKVLPEMHVGSRKIDVPRLSTRLGTLGPLVAQEPIIIPSLFNSLLGPQVAVAKNTIGAAINLTEAVVFRRSKTAKNYLK